MSRNTLFIAFAVLLGFQTSFIRGQERTSKPNVLFIAVDDLKPILGCYGDEKVITPNIDRIAEKGTVMTANYCQQAICAPSRISLFTGMRPDYTGVLDLQTRMRDVNPTILTIPQYFKQNGYATVGLGKLMHGAKGNDPRSWTIPYRQNSELTYADGYEYPANGRYQDTKAMEIYKQALNQKLSWKETNDLMKARGVMASTEFLDVPDDAYPDGAIAREGIELLKEFSEGNQPFFLALGFMRPHLPFVAPLKYHDLYNREDFQTHPFQEHAENSPDLAYSPWAELRGYSDIPLKGSLNDDKQLDLIHGYYACASYVDAQIGLVYEKLIELGLAENTIIVLWGDHGWHLGDHGLWCKHTNFEQATHSPLIIVDPTSESLGRSNALTEFVDIFPTLCDLAGLDTPLQLHGTSLVPLMTASKPAVKDYAISQYPRGNVMGYSLRDQRYRLTWWIRANSSSEDGYEIVAKELYDYRKDPLETCSYSGAEGYVTIESGLSKSLDEYIQTALQMNRR